MNNIFAFVIFAAWIAFILYWIISAVGVKRDSYRAGRGWWWFALIFVVVFVIFDYTPYAKLHLVPQTPLVGAIADVLCVGGIAYAIWARRHLGKNWSPRPALKEGHELVTSGPYRLVRHPIYTGILAAFIGSALVSGAPWLVAIVIVGAMFVARVKTEEGIMTKQFPDQYPEYKKKTWALIPFIW